MTTGGMPAPRSSRLVRLGHEVGKFGIVGAVAYVADVGIFNVLRFTFDLGPTTSKTISTLVAVTIAYFGNRNWTWRERTRNGFRREYLMFALVNGGGLAIQLAFLDFTVYVLGREGRFAENLSGNVIGVAFGTLFRFWAYRKWVFPAVHPDAAIAGTAAPDDTIDPLETTTTTPY